MAILVFGSTMTQKAVPCAGNAVKRSSGRVRIIFAVVSMLWFALGVELAAHEDLEEQIELFTAEIARSPKDAVPLLKRAELYRLHKEWAEAFADYRRVEELDSPPEQLRFLVGRALLESGQIERAKKMLDEFIAGHPEHVEALRARARLHEQEGRPELAAEDLKRAIDASARPEPELYYERAALLASDGGNIPAAIAALDEGIERLGLLVSLQSYAIDLELRRGDTAAALKRVERVLAGLNRKEFWLVRKAEVQIAGGKHEEAEQTLNEALREVELLPVRHKETEAIRSLKLRVQALRHGAAQH